VNWPRSHEGEHVLGDDVRRKLRKPEEKMIAFTEMLFSQSSKSDASVLAPRKAVLPWPNV
jgi:hypothetical protein